MNSSASATEPQMLLAQQLQALVTAGWKSQAVYAAAELGIADLLKSGPRSSHDLAIEMHVHQPSLQRLLLALCTLDICRAVGDDVFELAPMGRLLQSDSPTSLRSMTLWWARQLSKLWENLPASVKSGHSARQLLYGKNGFEQLRSEPELAGVFHAALREWTHIVAVQVLRAYDFSGLNEIVDVGGGHGELLVAILRAYPQARGMILDLPQAEAGARQHISQSELGGRCEFQQGDFSSAIPGGADVYLLKNILHDWDDANSLTILKNCRTALKNSARLLIIEQVMNQQPDADADDQAVACSDLTMMLAHGAQERTAQQYRRLVAAAGLQVVRVSPIGLTYSLIETSVQP